MSSARPSPSELSELLAAVRKLREALADTSSSTSEHGTLHVPLSDDAAEGIFDVFGRALKAPGTWAPGVETKLNDLLSWNVVYCGNWDDPNRIRQRNLDTAREIEAALTALTGGPSNSAAVATAASCRFERIGNVWHVEFGTDKTRIADTRCGLHYCARLLEVKHRPVEALEIEGQQHKVIPPHQSDAPVLDAATKADYQRRLSEIEEAMKEVEEFEDRSEYDKLTKEKERLLSELKAASGLAGRDRRLGGGNESDKAADRVRKNIDNAIKQLRQGAAKMAALAEHLDKYVKKEGDKFVYRPAPPEPDWHIGY